MIPILPDRLRLDRDPWETVAFHGAPMFRAQAWALWDFEFVGKNPLAVFSADRREGVAERFGKMSQAALFRGWVQRRPGFNPANPPGRSSHELRSDGNWVYDRPAGATLPNYMLGLDVVCGSTAAPIVRWLNEHGYSAVCPYPDTREAHHMVFTRDPVKNARKRLQKYQHRTLIPGKHGDDVRRAQAMLRDLGFIPANRKLGKLFGPRMALAVRAFRKANGFGKRAMIGPRTWRKLEEQFEKVNR